MDDRNRTRLDMIEPGIFFVLCENKDGGITGRAHTNLSEALAQLGAVAASDSNNNTQPLGLAA